MLIGDKPGDDDEQVGAPHRGQAGAFLEEVMAAVGMDKYPVYMTNVLGCRSCTQMVGIEGLPITRKYNGQIIPVWRDEAPLSEQLAACADRIYEEIYLVDPVIIVAMGSTAIEFLTKKSMTISKEHGTIIDMNVPGRGYVASITEKKKQWIRKYSKGKWEAPVIQNQVMYMCVATYSPAFALSKVHDNTEQSPLKQFGDDMGLATKIYEKYQLEVYGCLNSTEEQEEDKSDEEYTEETN